MIETPSADRVRPLLDRFTADVGRVVPIVALWDEDLAGYIRRDLQNF